MTTSTSIRGGWTAALTHKRLVVTVWLWGAALGLSAAIPVWRWLSRALDYSPYSDRVLERFSVGFLIELTQYDRFSPLLTVNGEVIALLLLGLLTNPLIAGGALEVVASRDDRPLLHRFMRGAGHFYGRFLRLLIVTGVASLLPLIAIALVMGPLVSALGESSYERLWITAWLARVLLFAAAVGFMMIVADIARAQVVLAETEVRGMIRAWWRALRFVFGHFGTVLGVYLALALLTAVAFVVYVLVANAIPAVSWAGIVLAFVVQQAFMIVRAALRVIRAGASVELARDGTAAPIVVQTPVEPVLEPRVEEPVEAVLP
jgi:hypothetical protein